MSEGRIAKWSPKVDFPFLLSTELRRARLKSPVCVSVCGIVRIEQLELPPGQRRRKSLRRLGLNKLVISHSKQTEKKNFLVNIFFSLTTDDAALNFHQLEIA